MAETTLPDDLRAWVEQTAEAAVELAERRPGGGRREAWVIDARRPDGAGLELFLRLDRSDPVETGDPYTLHREAEIYLALADTPVPVPKVLGVHPSIQAALAERVAGETWFSRLRDPDQRLSVARDFMRHLVSLHQLDPAHLKLPSLHPVRTAAEHVSEELTRWRGMYEHRIGETSPAIELALGWLETHVPDYDGPVVLLQGDTGPGNFLYADGRVTTVLDWELGHLGDPMEDLAWLSLRAAQEPFTELPERVAEYVRASGHELDLGRIRYYQVFAELRCAILAHRRRVRRSGEGEVGNGLIYGALHDRLLIEALGVAMGVPLGASVEADETLTEYSWLFDAALEQLRDVIVPRSSDPFVVLRAKGLARILKHLREVDRLGGRLEREDRDAVAALLGDVPEAPAERRRALTRALREGRVEPEALLSVLEGQVSRQTLLLRPAMGALADRHLPDVVA